MMVFLNGRYVPQENAVISVFDRGFLYGDGLFETIRIYNGRLFRWEAHSQRLQAGLDYLKINSPYRHAELRDFALRLIAENQSPDSLLRLNISRGPSSRRGYSSIGADTPTVVMAIHPAPPRSTELPRWRVITSNIRLPANEPLANIKTCNKIHQVLARAEADAAGADDIILLNSEGFAVEGSSSNLFWIQDNVVNTPPLPSGILPGVTRSIVLELCRHAEIETRENRVTPQHLVNSDGVFLTLTSLGIVECQSLNGKSIRSSEMVAELFQQYHRLLESETAESSG